jgi:hypothetical protein
MFLCFTGVNDVMCELYQYVRDTIFDKARSRTIHLGIELIAVETSCE